MTGVQTCALPISHSTTMPIQDNAASLEDQMKNYDMSDNEMQLMDVEMDTNDSSLQNQPPQQNDTSSSSQTILGPQGQVCSSQHVLDYLLKNYTHIHTNLYRAKITVNSKSVVVEASAGCDCVYRGESESDREFSCGDASDCINRALNVECGDGCLSGVYCRNKR